MPTAQPQASSAGAIAPARPRLRWTYLGPLVVFAVVAVFLGIGLTRNPREAPKPPAR